MSDDDGEIEDLFGAFEGGGDDNDADSATDDVTPAPSAPAAQDKEEAAAPAPSATETPDEKMEDTVSSTTPQEDATPAVLSAADILSVRTLSSASSQRKATPVPAPVDALAAADKEREIATGTSHDKSIRSYSAIPDHLYYETKQQQQQAHDTERRPPAKTYPFELDPFQKQAIEYVENGESVLVAAHTSAGKTAVAEYAVAKSLRDGQRVIYTSPIKALSNQKYRDLQEEFSDVGLMTGDITINNTATCLVMTTEILRSMLYRGSEIMREVAWVIYDEVHYMRDKERGVVWEESIILLPHKVRFVFLSATIPNASQFVNWIAKIHRQPCHVVYTNYRPVPLQHYIFPTGGDGLHLVVDEKGKFREGNFQKAMATLKGGGDGMESALGDAMLSSGGRGFKRKRQMGGHGGKHNSQSTDLFRIVKLVMERNLNPVIVFSFSKKDCEKYALELNKEDYTDDIEKDLISQVYTNAIDSLGKDDQKLPQVEALLPLLKRGIGIHHGGLLPILKEIVEILFSEGLIKCLFATETFAIGINMPAKTVVFTNCRKWDGKDFRWVTSGEYIQMSGRAGRRGKDDRGIVIQMLDEKMEPDVCKGILYGDPDPLNSSYRISYNMLLNMMRVDDVDPEYLLKASFHQFQQESEAPALEIKAEELEGEAEAIKIEEEDVISEYYGMDRQLDITKQKMMKIIRKPEYMVPYLNASGRLLDITIDGENFGWGALVTYRRKAGLDSAGSAGKAAAASATPEHTIDVLVKCVDRHFDSVARLPNNEAVEDQNLAEQGLLWRGTVEHCRPVKDDDESDAKVEEMRLFTLTLDNIDRVSAVRIFMPQGTTTEPNQRKSVGRAITEVGRRLKGKIPVLDPVTDLRVKGPEFEKLVSRASVLTERLKAHRLLTSSSEQMDVDERMERLKAYGRKATLMDEARAMKKEARSCQAMVMKDELRKMKRVLKHLGHVDVDGVIQTKGRTACEINTANELVVVELVFTGVFNDLSVEQCVALLSCMTYDERMKDADDPTAGLKSFLSNPFHKLQESTRVVAKATSACKIEIDEEEMVNKINPGMMEAVFAWCKGAKFVEVQKLTGSFEGTTIRTLRRLEELVRQLTSASKAIGNHELQTKFEKGSELIKRDIVFCSSLYL